MKDICKSRCRGVYGQTWRHTTLRPAPGRARPTPFAHRDGPEVRGPYDGDYRVMVEPLLIDSGCLESDPARVAVDVDDPPRRSSAPASTSFAASG